MIISLMPDYSNAKIYKLVSDKTDMIYIGSTVRSLKERLKNHKSNFTNKKKTFITSKKLYELGGNISIELIKLFPCDCRKELELQESKYIREYKNICVNKIIVGRTRKEWNEDNKEKILEQVKKYSKKYREDNKEIIKEKRKKYCEDNKEKMKEKYKCECGSEIRKDSKRKHKRSIKHISFINNNK